MDRILITSNGYKQMVQAAHVHDNEESASPFFKPLSALFRVPKAPAMPTKKLWDKKDKFSTSGILSVQLDDIVGVKR